MQNILTEPVKIGNFKVPAGLLLLAGASLLAVVALTQKQKGASGSGQNANAFLGLYDGALTDVQAVPEPPKSVSVAPTFAINPLPTNTVQQPISQSQSASSLPQLSASIDSERSGLNALNDYLQKAFNRNMTNIAQPFTPITVADVIDRRTLNTSIQSPNAGEVMFSPTGIVGQQISMPFNQLPRNSRNIGSINGVPIYGL